MKDTIKIRYSISTSKVGSECSDVIEFNRARWQMLSDDEREREVKEYAFNEIEWGYWEDVGDE